MSTRKKRLGCFLIVVTFVAVPAVLLYLYDPWPGKEAMEAGQKYAAERGYNVGPGGLAEFVTQPDGWGGCEVEVTFGAGTITNPDRVIVMRLSRRWRGGVWQLTAFVAREKPEKRR
jgi:hypothetical protein